MNSRSSELIQKYLLGIATEEEVRELESGLELDVELQQEFLLQAEIDAHLRQEVQSITSADQPKTYRVNRSVSMSGLWKWVFGIPTLAASILLALLVLYLPPARQAIAVPSLGKLHANVSWTKRSIWVAAGTGDLPMLQAELQRSVAIDARSEEAVTPLHVAALFGQAAAAELLLSLGADVTLTDKEGNTALHMAVFLGHSAVVRTLLAHGADPLARNDAGFSPVEVAAAPWSEIYVEHLRQAEAEMNTSLDMNRIRGERFTILKLLVGSDRVSQQSQQPSPPSGIIEAAIAGDVACLQEHVDRGTDLNQTEQVGGSTALTLAAVFGNREAASVLIKAGADLEIQDKSGGTALHQACFFARPEIVELLLDAGADPTKVNAYGVTPLELAPEQLNTNWKAVYEHTYQSLSIELDFEALGEAHNRIRNIFQQRSTQVGESQ